MSSPGMKTARKIDDNQKIFEEMPWLLGSWFLMFIFSCQLQLVVMRSVVKQLVVTIAAVKQHVDRFFLVIGCFMVFRITFLAFRWFDVSCMLQLACLLSSMLLDMPSML